MDVKDLTPAQCILLTVHLASESNIQALHSFTPTRLDALDPELVLRILLTYLPEALDPREYRNYVAEVASRLYLDVDRQEVEVNTAPVRDLSPEQAEKRVRKLSLLALRSPSFPPDAPEDSLTRFLCHRAHKIDAETGLLNLVPALIEPFLERNAYLRVWYISVILPLRRLELEYYPQDPSWASVSIADFEALSGREGIDFLLKPGLERKQPEGRDSPEDLHLGRDIKGLVGPWIFGHTERKRRKVRHDAEQAGVTRNAEDEAVTEITQRVQKIELSGVSSEDKTGHDWEHLYHWMVHQSIRDFSLVASAIEEWDGPSDVDLEALDHSGLDYLDEDLQRKLEKQYAQAAFASCYAAQANTSQTVQDAHSVLARLAELLDFIPPPDLVTTVDSLPRIERHAARLEESQTTADIAPEVLMRPEHPLTTPRLETYMLLQMIVYSAYQFTGMGHSLSLNRVAKLHFYATPEEQFEVFRKILRGLSSSGARRDEAQWIADRAKLMWLWNWGIEPDDEDALHGPGVLGKIDKETFQEEMLKTFVDTNCKCSRALSNAVEPNSLPEQEAPSLHSPSADGPSVDEVDPTQNANALGAATKAEDVAFPFVATGLSTDGHAQELADQG